MPRGELAPVMMTTLSLRRLSAPRDMSAIARRIDQWARRDFSRPGRVPSYTADLWYVFEGSRVSGLDDELLAEGLQAVFGRGRHAGVQEGFDELFVLVGRHVGADEVGD